MTLREAVESLIPWADAYSDLAQRTNRPRREADEAYDAVLQGRQALIEDQQRNCDHVWYVRDHNEDGEMRYRCQLCGDEGDEGDPEEKYTASERKILNRHTEEMIGLLSMYRSDHAPINSFLDELRAKFAALEAKDA